MAWIALARSAGAAEWGQRFDFRQLQYTIRGSVPPSTAAKRIAWELRKRTSIEVLLEPTRVRLRDAELFNSPFLYWRGGEAFPPLDQAEVGALRRFVDFGGFVLIDDSSRPAGKADGGFDASIRRDLARAFGPAQLQRLPSTHTVYRSFYLLRRPVGRIEGPAYLEAIQRAGRAAVIYSRHDLGGAWERDNLGNWTYAVVPAGEDQREQALRLGVNLVMYALCLDYKDDRVHAPFIMRRYGTVR
ncbi:MAG: DUF4159 domain-containing protein [Proteobacteria bacterium]|nr:DUF4159 domain-containing protein [Pseudomonadota bacterium]